MSKMFSKVTRTWNYLTGCTHDCVYCWARELAFGRLRQHYPNGFVPEIHPERRRKFKDGSVVFPTSMGDMFCDGMPNAWIGMVNSMMAESPNVLFMPCTKNPGRCHDWILPPNVILGCTIETNRSTKSYSKAPEPSVRYDAMRHLPPPNYRKFISIEPIMDFDHDILVEWMRAIEPEFVYVGFDNYNNNLPEPSIDKANQLVSALREFTEVHIKTWKI